MIPALLGAFASIGGAGLGAMASDNAAAYNYQADLLNYYSRERERRDAIRQAEQQRSDSHLGMTDAQGNRVRFVEGVGWVTDLSDQQQELSDLYQQEELNTLINDLPKKRQVLNANVKRQGDEDARANALLDAFGRVRRGSTKEYENQLNEASTRGITEGFDSALSDAMRASIRTGASNSGAVAAAVGSERSKALRDAFMNNKINARGQTGQEFDSKRADIANLYNMFATRASSMPDVAYNPRNIEGITSAQMGQAAQRGDAAGGALINAFAKQGGSMDRIEPNYGWANAVASGGNALSEAFANEAARKYKFDTYDDYSKYSGVNPSMYQGSRGAW